MRSPSCIPILAAVVLAGTSLPSAAQSVYPTGTTIWTQGSTYDGYTLFVEREHYEGVLIDMDGTVVNTWVSPHVDYGLYRPNPLDNGHVLFLLRNHVTRTVRDVVELDYDSNVVWSWSLPANIPNTTQLHHDVERLPNGNTMILGVQKISNSQISQVDLADDFIFEVDPGGKVVWSWEAWKHIPEFGFPKDQQQLLYETGGDWAHGNSIAVIPSNSHTDPALAEGNVIVSFRYTNTIFIIDKATGSIVWKLGPGEDHITHGQHLPYMIPPGLPGEGNILVFDNGSGVGYCHEHRSPGQSSVKEIDPVTKTVVWEYHAWRNFWSDIVSNAERQPNGNTVICSGVKGRLFEVDAGGVVVWEYMSPYNYVSGQVDKQTRRVIYRCHRLPYGWAPR